jgi:tellurite resistance protein
VRRAALARATTITATLRHINEERDMDDFFPEIDIRQDQAEAIARGLFAVAKSDGVVHDREAAIIAEFFVSTTSMAADLNALERAPKIEGASLKLMLPTNDLRRLFTKTAILLAYADGAYGAKESGTIAEYAKALEISDKDLALLEQQVKEFLLSQLTGLANVDAAVQVAKEMKL